MAEPDGPDLDAASVGPWVDNHCHLGVGARGGDAPPVEDVLAEARRHGVVAMITVGTDAASSSACLAQAGAVEGVWATAGVHPHDATEGTGALREVVAGAIGGGALVAIGECGLDYHYDHSPRPTQLAVFAEQVALAHEVDLPLVIHTRDAWEDTFAVLDEVTMPRRTVFHCFTGGPAEAEACVGRGALLSISGIVTFPGAQDLRDAVLGGAAGLADGGDRLALPGTRAAPWPHQPACLGGARRRRAGPAARGAAAPGRRDDDRERRRVLRARAPLTRAC